jgi:hypothetical protein
MKRTIAWAASAAALAFGCSSVTVDPGVSGGTTSGSGGATTTSSMASGGSTSFTTSSTGGGPACSETMVFVDVQSDMPLDHFDVSCAPVGNIDYGGGPGAPPPPPDPPPPPSAGLLFIHGCSAKGSGFGIELRSEWMMFPGASNQVRITYWHDSVEYHESPTDGASLEVTKLDPTGGVIEGTFSGSLTPLVPGNGPPMLVISGKFRICHGNDFATV